MNNEIMIFENAEFGTVRTMEIDGEVWFVLKDVCDVLGLSNPTVVSNRLDEDERTKFNLGRQGLTTIVNESGLYAVIMRSDKPIAKPFRKWVTSEVLPSIRKTGNYSITQSKEDSAALAVLHANDNTSRLIALAEYKNIIETPLLETIAEQKPHVDIALNRIERNGCYKIKDVTSGLNLKQGQITNWAKNNGYIHKTRTEVNNKGIGYFKIYSEDNVHNNMGITKDGVELIRQNIDDVRIAKCKSVKVKVDC